LNCFLAAVVPSIEVATFIDPRTLLNAMFGRHGRAIGYLCLNFVVSISM
jgi:hypothetical protein